MKHLFYTLLLLYSIEGKSQTKKDYTFFINNDGDTIQLHSICSGFVDPTILNTPGIPVPMLDDLMYSPQRDQERREAATARDLIRLYDEFAQVCYNDSSWYHYHVTTSYIDIGYGPPDPVKCTKMDCRQTSGQRWQYTDYVIDYGWHRPDPNDLKSFINYLRTK
jgi:hypothetical protein